MNHLRYDFRQYNQVLSQYLEVVKNNSAITFQNQVRNGQIKNRENDVTMLAESIMNIEEYLYYYFTNFPNNFNSVLNSIINNVKTIACLPSNQRGIYGKAEPSSKIIYINPELSSSRTLTGHERTRLYMAHELGHIVNNEWMKRVEEYCDRQLRSGALTQEHVQLIYDGFSMLNEATTQDRAENFAYSFAGKTRPQLQNVTSQRLFNGHTYRTNYDFYGELQEPAIMFARTLRGIGKENDDTKALRLLSSRALSPEFFNTILNEYAKDGQMPSFIKEMQYMGLLKRAAYANFGMEDMSYCRNSEKYLTELTNLTSQMRDYREPFNDTGR